MSVSVKICGLSRLEDVVAAHAARANYVGFVFFPKSLRNVSIEQAAALAVDVPVGVCKVALVVNADNAALDAITDAVPLDMLQLHGSESADRVAEVRARYGLPVMKAVGIAEQSDLLKLDDYLAVADQILVDAKPPKDGSLPGGNGLAFDWTLLSGRRWPKPWMLAGGLTPSNVQRALNLTGAQQVDVSSGVESAPGVKDPALMAEFVAAAKGAPKAL
ncbi:phosphoribosylanthranilate isomerase [Pontivivens insulae]|uniref:N-(5'-phosphoribosyl)anthranilate isomerase n=1 Tax=Pontivivens insulae TaxID=1639689 RepID=A0A2R8ADN9_9RHOB|nr:phosphoribosylanthranilate isomerase [Pontivivens insulae]RED14124.1 phosphoribosylanthranilate isomerase [Pontivivens insulae]SPF30198.1 N-(5'-phosphoribosyl)anthranilate isomerase [Pontivivens insulae]